MAFVDSQNVQLRDGRHVTIRCAQESDAAALIEAATNIFRDGEGMIAEPDEFNKTEDEERTWIRSLNENPKELLLVAESNEKIVGGIDFHIARQRRCAHWGSFGISVQPGWRNCGIGNALLTRLLQWARSSPEIEKVCLAVRADNPRAIALYKKLGFVESGRAKDAIKLGHDRFVDNLSMELFVRS